MEARLSKFTELNDTVTPSQQGSRITRQTHDAIYARIATIHERSQYGFPSYCCFIDFATAYPSVHRERLGLTLKTIKSLAKFGTYSKKTPEMYEFGFSMPSSTKTMKWTFSAVSQKEADLAAPSLASAWQNLSSNYEQNSHSLNSLKSLQLMTSTGLDPFFMSMTWFS